MNVRKISVIFFSLAILLPMCAGSMPAKQARAAESTPARPEIVVEVPIPGTTFPCDAKFPGKNCVESFGTYISGFYKFFAGAIGIIAAMMVMWGGVKWVTAAGNASRVTDAKDTIYSALIALIITFGSYLLLYTINPQIVKLELPNINTVAKIMQASDHCSDNFSNGINKITGCDPRTTECCGHVMNVDIGGGKSSTCIWDVCNARDQVCVLPDKEGQYGSLPNPPCVSAQNICFTNADGDKRAWCPMVDTLLRQAKSGTGDPKFVYTGCGFDNVSGLDDQCRWSMLLNSFFTFYQLPPSLSAFQPQFIDCYTEGAKDVCWELKDGKKQPKNCGAGASRQPCANPIDVPRPVAGASSGCLVKIGRTGSADKNDYTCWAVPLVIPPVDAPQGWGNPLTY